MSVPSSRASCAIATVTMNARPNVESPKTNVCETISLVALETRREKFRMPDLITPASAPSLRTSFVETLPLTWAPVLAASTPARAFQARSKTEIAANMATSKMVSDPCSTGGYLVLTYNRTSIASPTNC